MLLWVTFVFILLKIGFAQDSSPCPDVFIYEERGPEEDRWYGRVLLKTEAPLFGLWLRIELDRPADLLGNWFATATSRDNKLFVIKNSDYLLEPNREPLSICFFVKYNKEGPIPLVTTIGLNGRTICPSNLKEITTTTTEAPQLDVKWNKNSSAAYNNQQAINETTIKDQDYSDDDFFPGDFSFSNRSIASIPALSSVVLEEKCGIVKVPVHPLITYGQSTTEGEWPWHAALYRSKSINFQYICGGSLITPNHVLTAAHCVTKPKTEQLIDPELFIVYLGKYNLNRLGPSVQDKTIKNISLHSEFNATYLRNNVAVLHLNSPVQITDFVRTVCLWEDDVSLDSVVKKLGTVVGWGFDQSGTLTENLMQAKMPIVTTETCIFSNRDFFSLFTSSKTYCAGFRNGTSACVGDSGGGMVFPKSGSRGQNIVWQLRGIISLSAALRTKIVCDISNYIVFTDVAKHLDWIRNVTKS